MDFFEVVVHRANVLGALHKCAANWLIRDAMGDIRYFNHHTQNDIPPVMDVDDEMGKRKGRQEIGGMAKHRKVDAVDQSDDEFVYSTKFYVCGNCKVIFRHEPIYVANSYSVDVWLSLSAVHRRLLDEVACCRLCRDEMCDYIDSISDEFQHVRES